MADLTIKRHDTWPPLGATLSDENGPIDLTTASQVLVLLKSSSFLVDGTCTIDTPKTNGHVTYAWVAGDTANSGTYEAEFQIDWGSGRIETVPNDSYDTVTIMDDLGP